MSVIDIACLKNDVDSPEFASCWRIPRSSGQEVKVASLWDRFLAKLMELWFKFWFKIGSSSSLSDRNVVDLTNKEAEEIYCGDEISNILGCSMLTDGEISVFLAGPNNQEHKDAIKEREGVLALAWKITSENRQVSSQLLRHQIQRAVISIAGEIAKGSKASRKMKETILAMARLFIDENANQPWRDAVLSAASRMRQEDSRNDSADSNAPNEEGSEGSGEVGSGDSLETQYATDCLYTRSARKSLPSTMLRVFQDTAQSLIGVYQFFQVIISDSASSSSSSELNSDAAPTSSATTTSSSTAASRLSSSQELSSISSSSSELNSDAAPTSSATSTSRSSATVIYPNQFTSSSAASSPIAQAQLNCQQSIMKLFESVDGYIGLIITNNLLPKRYIVEFKESSEDNKGNKSFYIKFGNPLEGSLGEQGKAFLKCKDLSIKVAKEVKGTINMKERRILFEKNCISGSKFGVSASLTSIKLKNNSDICEVTLEAGGALGFLSPKTSDWNGNDFEEAFLDIMWRESSP